MAAAPDGGLMPGAALRSRPLAAVLAVALASAGLSAAGCSRTADGAPDVRVELTVAPDPPAAGPAIVTLRLLAAADGSAVTGASVQIEGTMSHAGMRSVFGTAREEGPGVYAAPLELTMGGDWILLVDAELADGRHLHRELRLPGVRPR
jgi:hypothetical protein